MPLLFSWRDPQVTWVSLLLFLRWQGKRYIHTFTPSYISRRSTFLSAYFVEDFAKYISREGTRYGLWDTSGLRYLNIIFRSWSLLMVILAENSLSFHLHSGKDLFVVPLSVTALWLSCWVSRGELFALVVSSLFVWLFCVKVSDWTP